jgi:hypothetical protein
MTQLAQDEFVIAKGNLPLPAALKTYDPIDLQGVDHFALYFAAEQAGTWLIEGKFLGQWIPLATGTYIANKMHVLYASGNLPPIIRLKVTPTVANGDFLAGYRIGPTEFSTAVDPSTLPTLTWVAGVNGISFVELFVKSVNPSFALTYDAAGHITQIDKTDGGSVYRKTLTWVGDNLTAISTWAEV